MIPPPVDPVLLHEHAYQDTGDLNYVLHLETFTNDGGYKPVLKYGLGFFNYDLALKDEIYDMSWLDILRFHIYEHFIAYFSIFIVLFLIWVFIVAVQLGHASYFVFGKDKKFFKRHDKEDDFEYRHIKV